MIFTFNGSPQQIKEQQEVQQYVTRVCESRPGCVDCELKEKDLQIANSIVRCNTGRGDIK